MAKPLPAGRRKALAPATVTAINGLTQLNGALERARERYQRDLINERPPSSITVKEFLAHYNKHAAKVGLPDMAQRTAEQLFQNWHRDGEYQRAPIMIASQDGKPRRTYVYWETKR